MVKKKTQKTRMLSSPGKSKPPIPATPKADLASKAQKLVENVRRPRYVQPPPKEPCFNYITDIWMKWIGSTLYFGATYACPGPNAISPSFESRFARMEPVGAGLFVLSYMRRNDKWFRLQPPQTGDACLDALANDWHFDIG